MPPHVAQPDNSGGIHGDPTFAHVKTPLALLLTVRYCELSSGLFGLADPSEFFPLGPSIGGPIGHPEIDDFVALFRIGDRRGTRGTCLARFFRQFREKFLARCAGWKLEINFQMFELARQPDIG